MSHQSQLCRPMLGGLRRSFLDTRGARPRCYSSRLMRGEASLRGMQADLLYSPIREFADVQVVLASAID